MLRVVYLIFNEGYVATEGDRLVREELCAEAIRLGDLLTRLMPDEAEVWGLSALMLLHDARRDARVDASGRYIALDAQDRSLWDQDRIRTGLERLARAIRLGTRASTRSRPHRGARDRGAEQRRDRLGADRRALRGPGRAQPVAGHRAQPRRRRRPRSGPAAGLELLEPLLGDPALERYQPLYAAHADLLRRAGDAEGAASAYEEAIALTANAVEREELERRLRELT